MGQCAFCFGQAFDNCRRAGSATAGDEERSLAELTTDIEQDAALRAEARKELDRLPA